MADLAILSPSAALSPSGELLAEVGARWMAAMQAGDFEAAWCQTDRLEHPRRSNARSANPLREAHHLLWDGQPWAGCDVLVRCEHGLGDSLQYLRYCPLLRETARQVKVRAQPALLEVLRGMEGIDELADAWTVEPDPPHDVALECMELAYAFRHTARTLPHRVPYLPVARLRGWTPALLQRSQANLQVALIWAASAWNPRRSIPLAALQALGQLKRTTFYSLQQGPERGEAATTSLPLHNLAPQTQAIERAAGAMLGVDLVITVDSMTAHLAGALGRPVWLLLTDQPDWRWQQAGTDSPWYPTMRIFRQQKAGCWGDVVGQLLEALRSLEAKLK